MDLILRCERSEPRRMLKPNATSLRRSADGLAIVAGRSEHEGAVIVRMVMRAQPRRAIVAPTRRHCRLIEGIDGAPVGRRQRHVDIAAGDALLAHPEIRLAVRA